MRPSISLLELAHDLGDIAAKTSDAIAAVRLLALVNRVLAAAGLPPDL